MIQSLLILVSALRNELEQYGEMLALLDRQQQYVVARAAEDVFQSIGLIKSQGLAIETARAHREECRAGVARELQESHDTEFIQLIPRLPADYRPLVQALVEENNELLVRVRQRARQNHLLLSRSLELMQSLINTLFPGREPKVYNDQGGMRSRSFAPQTLYNAVG